MLPAELDTHHDEMELTAPEQRKKNFCALKAISQIPQLAGGLLRVLADRVNERLLGFLFDDEGTDLIAMSVFLKNGGRSSLINSPSGIPEGQTLSNKL